MITETLRDSTNKKLLIGAVVIILVAIGFNQLSLGAQGRIVEVCTFGDWPLEWAVRRQFARKQPELRAIIDFINEAPELSGLAVTPVGLQASLEANRTERHDLDQPNILQPLISIDAQMVDVDDDRVSVFLGSEVRGPSSFELSYFYPTNTLDVADCDSIDTRDREKIGACAFQLSPQWYARYQWYPEDLDELEKALDELN
jgi:hypothetical protein